MIFGAQKSMRTNLPTTLDFRSLQMNLAKQSLMTATQPTHTSHAFNGAPSQQHSHIEASAHLAVTPTRSLIKKTKPANTQTVDEVLELPLADTILDFAQFDNASLTAGAPTAPVQASMDESDDTDWSIADINPYIPIGVSCLTAAALAAAMGNKSSSSTTTAPTGSSIDSYNDNAGAIQNAVVTATTNTTDDTTPTFTGKLNSILQSGETLKIYRDDGTGVKEIGTASVGFSGKTWTYQDKNLLNGKTYVYTAAVVNADGESTASVGSFTLTIDSKAPTATTTMVSYADNVGSITNTAALSGTTTDDTKPVITGTFKDLDNTDVINVYRDGTLVGTATVKADGSGQWTFQETETLLDGKTYSYTSAVVDPTGNLTAYSSALTLLIDTTKPTGTVNIVNYKDDFGTITSTTSTASTSDDTTPMIQGTYTTLATGEFINVYRDGVLLGKAVIGASNAWSYQDTGLVDGKSYIYTTAISDAVGNLSTTSSGFSLKIYKTAPAGTESITFFVYNVETSTSTTSTDSITNDPTPMFNGTTSAHDTGDHMNIYRDGTLVGTATIATNGTWSFQEATLANGDYTYTAAISDAAGNISAKSAEFELTINTALTAKLASLFSSYTTNSDATTLTNLIDDMAMLHTSNIVF